MDDVLKIVGEFGRRQKVLYTLFSIPYVVTSMQLMGWVFVGAKLAHRCRLPDEPPDAHFGDAANSSCHLGNDTCTNGYVYDTSVVGDSVVKEWDLAPHSEEAA